MRCSLVPLALLVSFVWFSSVRADHHEGSHGAEAKSLFDGTSLDSWDGDSRFWRVEDGAIVGQTTDDNKAEKNTFLIYRGGEFDDFELTFDYQVEGFNSGIQYRSEEIGEFFIKGYQADFEAQWHDDGKADKFSGMFFEENGRMFMGQRGQAVVVRTNEDDGNKPHIDVIGSVGDPAELEQAIDRDGWNSYRIVADGHTFTHIINDRVMSVAFDEDTVHRKASGLIALQLHSGPPMTIRVRNITVRPLHDGEQSADD